VATVPEVIAAAEDQVAERVAAGVHVVQPRDTIGGIAKRCSVSVRQLARWNDLENGARIFPGDRSASPPARARRIRSRAASAEP
jgi:LysM repeat protein